MKKGLTYVVEKSDYFSQLVTLNFNKEKKFQTILGGILSLIIYGVSIAVIVISSIQLIGRRNPKTTYSQKNLENTPVLNLTSFDTLFVAFFQSPNPGYYQFYDPTYLSLNWYQFTSHRYLNGTQITSKTILPWVNCTNYLPMFLAKGLETYFTSNSLQLSFCLDMSLNLTIGGDFDKEFNSNIVLSLDTCRNSTKSNITCKSPDDIYKNMYDGYLNLVYFDKNADVNNYEKPFINFVNSFNQKVDPKLYKKIDLWFGLSNVTSDVGFIFEDKRTQSALPLERFNEDIITANPSSKVMNIYINISQNSSTYTRVYMKFQELAALFGGIFQAMTIVGYILTFPIAQFKMYEHMFNSLFIQKGQSLNKHHLVTTSKEIKKLHVLIEGNNYLSSTPHTRDDKHFSQYNPVVTKRINYLNKPRKSKIEVKTNNQHVLKHIDTKIDNYQSKISTKFRYDIKDIIYMYIFCCYKKSRAKLNIFEIGFKKLLKYLDFLEIMKTLQQFNQLKDVLLTRNQSKLFDYYNKPEMSKETEIKKGKSDSTYMELHNCYLKASEKNESKVNRKLVKNFDGNLKEIFKSFDQTKTVNNKLDKEV